MSEVESLLSSMGYVALYPDDKIPSWRPADLPALVGYPVPHDYLAFLECFPQTGMVSTDVVVEGINPSTWAPDRLYALAVLYAYCAKPSHDLLGVRRVQYELEPHYIVIGDDDGGNQFCMDLRLETAGQVSFLFQEEDQGCALVATSFTDFVRRLRRRRSS